MSKARGVTSFLESLVEAVPAAVLRAGVANNSCILSTRLGVEAARAAGLRARPLATKLSVMNPPFQTMMQEDPDNADPERWIREGARIVQLGYPSEREGWQGHLVAIVEERYLVDLSAGQLDRPDVGIRAEAFWTTAEAMARGERAVFAAEDGCVWAYDPEPERRDYLRAPAWSAYRVRRTREGVVSERIAITPDAPVAPTVTVTVRLP